MWLWIQRETGDPLWRLILGLLLIVLAAPGLRAVLPPAHEGLPNYDRRTAAPARLAPALRHRGAVEKLTTRVADAQLDFDNVTGSPAWVRSARGFLTGPEGSGRGVAAGTAARYAANDSRRGLKAFLDEHRGLFRHGPEALETARVRRDSVTPGTGLRTTVWQQEVAGVPVFEGQLVAHTTARGELAGISSRFQADPERASRRRTPDRDALLANPPVTARSAIARAARNVKQDLTEAVVTAVGPQRTDATDWSRFRVPSLRGETTARLVWLPLDDTELRLCWEVLLTRRTRSETFRVLIDAQTGEAWLRHGLTRNLSEAQFRVWTSDSPTPYSPGWPVPDTNQPPMASRHLVGTNALNFTACPEGWIPDGINETRGNNVDAHLDVDDDDAPDLPRPHGSPARVFDFPVDLSTAPALNQDASVVQLFYWCNWMHDRLYDLGFTEAAGNFQLDNFGRGGAGNDAVQADAQDGGDVNNANFTTLPDGSAPRMQMYVFTPATPDRDSCFDAEVVLHEYAHGLTERLVGSGSGLYLLQSVGLAEGWSDFYALSLLSEPADDPHAVFPMGAYVSHLVRGSRNNYYFGIRRYPYCTDLAKNPLTFKDIDPFQASSHPGVPRNVIGGGASEVHSQGEVWCMALWEARARLITRQGFPIGNQLMLELVTDALTLSPPNPNFIQARDAVLQADLVRTGGGNYRDLWEAFAKRGLGSGASSPNAGTTAGVVESFDVPDGLLVRPASAFLASGPTGGPFAPAMQTYTLTNMGVVPVGWRIVSAPDWLEVSPSSGTLPLGAGVSVQAVLTPAATAAGAGFYASAVEFLNEITGIIQPRSVTLRVGQPDFFTEYFGADDFDLSFSTLTLVPDGSPGHYAVCRQAATNFPTDPAGGISLALSDDSSRMVTLSPPNTVAIYGRRTNVFFVGANGYITFDRGDSSNVKTFENHFALPRVAALLEDLDPGAGGSVTWKPLADRVVVTYAQVPEFDRLNQNNFQTEMFFNGTLRLTWLQMDTRRGLTGISAGGGVPLAFIEMNLSSVGPCVASLGSISLTRAADGVLLSWPSQSGATYRVEFKTDLAAPQWTTLGAASVAGETASFLDPTTNGPQRFYRVVQP